MKRICFFTLILLAGACVERGSNDKTENGSDGYSEAVADSNDIKDNSEFKKAFTTSPYFSKWDANGDKNIDQDEFYKHYLAKLDKNQDQVLSKEEWQEGVKVSFGSQGQQKYGDFSKWDANGDGQIQSTEFQQYLKDHKIFEAWDKNGDGQLEEPEFAEETFAMWDIDGNGVIEADEYADEAHKTGGAI